MTFKCDSPTGRRCQVEETLQDLDRVIEAETHKRTLHHLQVARGELETVEALLREGERGHLNG